MMICIYRSIWLTLWSLRYFFSNWWSCGCWNFRESCKQSTGSRYRCRSNPEWDGLKGSIGADWRPIRCWQVIFFIFLVLPKCGRIETIEPLSTRKPEPSDSAGMTGTLSTVFCGVISFHIVDLVPCRCASCFPMKIYLCFADCCCLSLHGD